MVQERPFLLLRASALPKKEPMATSPVSPARSKARSAVVDFEEVRLAMIQGFVDLWHHNMVGSKMARTWGRKQILEPLLEVLEMLGVDLPSKGAEVLMRSDEEDMVQCISDNMPYDFQESFEDVMPQLVEAVGHLTNLRQSLEADDADAVVATMEAAFESQPLTATAALRHAVEHAATEVARVRSCHTTWKASTEARIYRLENAKDEAEKATQDYLVVEAKLSNFRGQMSDKSRACLMGMAEGSSKATLASCFASWRGTTEEGKVQQDLRDKYEAQLAEMQQQVLQYQALRLQNVRNAMARTVLENSDTILNTLFQTWVADTAQCVKMREGNRQLDDARLQLAAVARSRAASGRKIVAHMLEESRLGPLVMCYQAWTQFLETERREHATEENIRGLEKELKVLMDAKKAKLKNVLTSLVDGQTEDLLFEVVQAWVQASVEERRTREMDDAMGQFTGKLSMLKTRQVETAMEVRERMNMQGEMTLLCKYWGHWRLSTKAERLDTYFKRKLESKRKQVAGVQTLFQTFATQIEANLDVDADDDDLGGHESRRRKRHSGSRSQGSLPRGTSVPLPDIHQKAAVAS